jgi:hypothetical protein
MKWDKKNKDRLHDLFHSKALQSFMIGEPWETRHNEWAHFLESLCIQRVREGLNGRWMIGDRPARDRKHIIIKDPMSVQHGLKIPKDIALKFIVLGIP